MSSALWLPHSQKLEERFTFKSNFDDEVKVWYRAAEHIVVPRNGMKVPDVLNYRDQGIPVKFHSQFQPQKPEQLPLIAKSVALLEADCDHIFAAPTGWGKTYVGTEIGRRLGRRFCVITTKEDNLNQWVVAIKAVLGLTDAEIGIWRGDQTPKPEHKVVVGLIQSVSKGPERYGVEAYSGFGLVICDEVHRMAAETFSEAMWHFPSEHRLGMSATPWRKDGKDRVFTWHIGEVLIQATMEVLIPKVLIHRSGWKIPQTSEGQIPHDFGNISLLMKPMCRNPQRNAIILQYLMSAYEKGRNTIAFTDNLEHIDIIADLLLAAGIPEDSVGYYIGIPSAVYGGPKKGQAEIRKQHSTRKIVLATYSMASEGTNLPWLDTCVLMTPKANVEQIVGRIRREYDDKSFPLVVDIEDVDSIVVGNYAKSRRKWYESLGCEIKRFH